MPEAIEPTVLSLLPAISTIIIAFSTRRVVLALVAGVLAGGVILAIETGDLAGADIFRQFALPALISRDFAEMLLIYLLCLGGILGIWERVGGAHVFARRLERWVVRGPRSALLFAWLAGLLFHQGGTVSAVLTGFSARPVADRFRVSHEQLSLVVDSTASPAASVIPFNAWPIFIASLLAGSLPLVTDGSTATGFVFSAIPFNFYGLFAILLAVWFAIAPPPGIARSLRRARDRAMSTGELNAPGSVPLSPTATMQQVSDYRTGSADFLLPLLVLLSVAIVPYFLLGTLWIGRAFCAALLALILLVRFKGLPWKQIVMGVAGGCRGMFIGIVILGLALILGQVAEQLRSGEYLVGVIGEDLSPVALPALLTLICMGISFATGTSFGTLGVVLPVALPVAFAMNQDPVYVRICLGAVLGGSVFGDHASPVSDTSILTAMFTGGDLMDHIRSQLPMALLAAGLALAASTLAAAFL